ncbi:MAG: Mu-like prophage major head subunit gpT family protein [Phycisphaerae bacterium]
MAIIGTGLTARGIKAELFQRLGEVANQTCWRDLCTTIKSTTKTETYAFLGSVPQVREWGTGRKAKGLFAESFDIENLKYEATLEVDRDEIEDDQTGQIMVRVRELAERAARHPDFLIGELLKNGHSAGFHSYDGVPFFGATHWSGVSGTQDNSLAPAAVTATSPTAAEFRTAMSAAIAALLSLKDDQGEPMAMSAEGLVCVVPPSMLICASEAVNATLVSSGGTNVLSGAAKIIAFPWLSTASTWFLLKTDVSVRPFIFQDRKQIEFTALEADSDEGFRRDKFLYGVRARYRVTYGYWQFAIRNVFTQGE